MARNGSTTPAGLGKHGQSLWQRIQDEYDITDAGGRELLYQACCGVDRAESCKAAVERDGLTIGSRMHPAVKEEMAARAFVVRTLQKLGITNEPVKGMGRPSEPVGVSYKQLRNGG